jgi:hypothetical protein
MNGEMENKCGRKRAWPNFKVISRHFPGVAEEKHVDLGHDFRSPGRD